MPAHQPEKQFISLSYLLERKDWSPATVDRFLGKPDRLYTNPYCRRSKAALYSLHRVEAAERSRAFNENAVKLRARKAAAAKAAQTKLDQLLKQVAAMEVQVKVLPLARVEQEAIASYNGFVGRQFDGEQASKNSDRAFLERITVNYIRHELTEYDHQLWVVAGKSGAVTARMQIAQRIFGAIADAYPGFEEECRRQLKRRGAEISRH